MVWCFVCQCLSICSVIMAIVLSICPVSMAIVLSICPVSMAIVLYVFLRFIAADYPFGIVKLFLLPLDQCYCWWPICSENVISSVTFKWTSPNKKRWDNTPPYTLYHREWQVSLNLSQDTTSNSDIHTCSRILITLNNIVLFPMCIIFWILIF